MAQYFNLNLDTTGPSNPSITANDYYRTSGNVTLSASNASYMYVWTDKTASPTEIPSGKNVIAIPYNTTAEVSFEDEGTNYVHAIFLDEVGNESTIVTDSTIYDTSAPNISSVSIIGNTGYTNQGSCDVRVTFVDLPNEKAKSEIASLTLTGDITESPKTVSLNNTDITNGYKDIHVIFTSEDGTKTIYAQGTDNAGNISMTSLNASDSIILDRTPANAVLILREIGDVANLPDYVKNREFAAVLSSNSTDIVGYKLYGDMIGATSEPNDWITPVTLVSNRMVIGDNLEFTSGEGQKTITLKVIDQAGNVTTRTKSVVYDNTAPTVTLSANPTVISAQTGYNEVTFTYGATDTNALSSYQLKLGNTVIKSGNSFTNGMTETVTESEIVAISSGQGNKSFTLYVTDIADNTGSSSAVTVTVDLTAPTGTISVANGYYNTTTVSATIASSGDTGGGVVSKMKVWLDNAEGSASWVDYDESYSFTGVSEGGHVAHMKLMDSVGNISSANNSSSFIVDLTAPTGTIDVNSYTNSRNITATLSASDTNGVSKMKVWEGNTEPNTWEDYNTSYSLVLSTGDGSKTIKAKFKDVAGNESSVVSDTIVLDTDQPDVTLVLTNSGNTTQLSNTVNVTGFCARIGFTNETQNSPIAYYQLTGDFTSSSNEWIAYSADSGKNYMTVSGLNLTSSNGNKTITALLKDEAGNISATAASVTVTYDSSAPEITVAAPDYNIISKEHVLRRNASTAATIEGKYCDVCIFTWSSNEALQAFKVCVNEVGQTAASAEAIGTTYGSLNMSGGHVDAYPNTVTSTIFGKDFAATSAVNDVDGAYEIIVYGQDEGGTWSAVHVLS